MEVVALKRENYAVWDAFCAESDDAWFWHTSHWLEYTLHYRPALRPESHSFLVMVEGKSAAICPLIVERYAEGGEQVAKFTYGGECGPAPAMANALGPRQRKTVAEAVFARVDELAAQLDVPHVRFRISPLTPRLWSAKATRLNPLLRHGYLDISLASQVIDLTPNFPALLGDMRKGCRYDVQRSQKLLTTTVYDRDSITHERFEAYRLMHRKAAGGATRPLETFAMMEQWIRQGHAVLVAAAHEGRDVGFALISTYKNGAYYSSAADDPDAPALPVGHAMQWAAMQALKQAGVEKYEIGVQYPALAPHCLPSEKESNIALFKRGFGGETVPLWCAEKFYSRECYVRVQDRRQAGYSSRLPEHSPKLDAGSP